MLYKTKYLLASTALMACMMHAAPSFSDTLVRETVTNSPGGTTTVSKTVTETPTGTTVRTTTETGAAPDTTSVHVTTTTEQPGTTRTETRWRTVEHGVREINFVDFDVNRDGIQSINEVGEMLFKLYDTDNNEVIDNKEYEVRAVVTVMPVQKDVVVSYDFDGDGLADQTKHTYETFMQNTMLTRYDRNLSGLSPYEFTGLDFMAADVNKDKAIDLKEWQGTYISSIDKANKLKANLNK